MKFVFALIVVTCGLTFQAITASAITISIDYTYDANNFFDTQQKKDLLQAAADTLANRFTDNLSAIVPTGGSHWNATFYNPATGVQTQIADPTIPANTVVVYAGGRDLGSGVLGQGGYGGYNTAVGTPTFNTALTTRGQGVVSGSAALDFAPWGGGITFTTAPGTAWGFSNGAPAAGTYDFFTVALHELSHLLGFGLSDSWNNQRSSSAFLGPQSTLANGGVNVPISADHGHWQTGTQNDGRYTAMAAALYSGIRSGFTTLDFAGMDDIGWTLAPLGIPGDVNHDGVVDIVDLTLVAGTWQTAGPTGDANGDSIVDIQDVTVIANHWLEGSGGGGFTAVPEPGTWIGLTVGIAILATYSQRKRIVTP